MWLTDHSPFSIRRPVFPFCSLYIPYLLLYLPSFQGLRLSRVCMGTNISPSYFPLIIDEPEEAEMKAYVVKMELRHQSIQCHGIFMF